ncbi:hypothetical protein AB0O01_35220 [Streptomyces sp. NPDC093252]|uniref:hypothetical protein n=1 Tax=Streptomyces sp. NPDC093252 TaxID=3154980 RepID=UPI00343C6500
MTAIDQLLARARLHPRPRIPDDTHPHDPAPYPDHDDLAPPARPVPDAHPHSAATPGPGHRGTAGNPHRQSGPTGDTGSSQDLLILCTTALDTIRGDTLDFLTDQMPDLHSAWLLGCALHVAGINNGARFWWQYAAGDGHPPACHTLSLYHRSRGEAHAAEFYHRQARQNTTIPEPGTDTLTIVGTSPPECVSFDAGLPTVLRTLNRLTTVFGARPMRHSINALTHYVAENAARHYARHPGIEIPVPEPHFAEQVEWLLTATLPWLRRTHPRPTAPPLVRRAGTPSGKGSGVHHQKV